MNIKSKIVAALTLAVLVAPGISFAQTTTVAQLEAEIQSLTAQLQSLQAQSTSTATTTVASVTTGGTTIGGSTKSATATPWCYTFNYDLYFGMTGSAVAELQTALQKDGEFPEVTNTFDDQTKAAVINFQQRYADQILIPFGLIAGTGYVGSTTRAELNVLFGCPTTAPVTAPSHNTTPTVSLSVTPVSIRSGSTATLNWSTSNVTFCQGTNQWGIIYYPANFGPGATSQSVTPVASGNYTYTMTCYGPNGEAGPVSAILTVTKGSAPTVTISANPTTVTPSHPFTTITWSSTNATACTAAQAGGWGGLLQPSGSAEVLPTVGNSTYYIICSGPNGTSNQVSTTVMLASQMPPTAPTPVSAAPLTVQENTAYGNQTILPGTTNVRIGSYAFAASASGGVDLNTITIKVAPGATAANAFQNLKLVVNGVQFGAVQSFVNNNSVYTFSGAQLAIPAGTTVPVQVYADTLSSAAGVYAPATAVTGYTGVVAGSNVAFGSTSTVNGQTMTFGNSSPSLTVSAGSSEPPAGYITQNSIGNTLAVFNVAQTSNTEAVRITQLNVVAAVASIKTVKPAFSNVSLWSGGTELGVAQVPVADAAGTGYLYTFNLSNPAFVPQGGAISLTLKGDAGSYANGAITDGSSFTFEIVPTTDTNNNTPALAVVALGASTNNRAAITLSNANGNPQTVVRTTLAVVGQSVGKMPPAGFQQIGSITLIANSAGDAVLNGLKLTTNQTNPAFLGSLVLRDQSGNDLVAIDGVAKSSVSGNTVTWIFSPSTRPLDIPPGNSYTLSLWGNISDLPVVSNIAQALTVSIAAPGDLSYYDGMYNNPTLLNLSSAITPISVVNVQGTIASSAPTVTISANPTSVTTGGITNITWSSTNATACTASNAWSGVQATSGAKAVTQAGAGNYTYAINCTGPGGASNTASAVVTVTATVPTPTPTPGPTITISASPATITLGQSALLTWTSLGAASCTDTGGWSGNYGLNGDIYVTPKEIGKTTYTLTCFGSTDASSVASAVVTVTAPAPTPAPTSTPTVPVPTVTISVIPSSIVAGQEAQQAASLTWSSTNATYCTASNAWTGTQATSGGKSITQNNPGSYFYTITCTGPGGTSNQASANLLVSPAPPAPLGPAPTVTISLSPASVATGVASTLTWSSTNATSCTASNSWTGTQATSGSKSVTQSVAGTDTYAIACVGSGGQTSVGSAVLTVTPPATTFTSPTLTATVTGGAVKLTWTAGSASLGLAGYKLYRSNTPGFTPSASNFFAYQPAGTLSFNDTYEGPGIYYYAVAPQDVDSNIGPASNIAVATVPALAALVSPAPNSILPSSGAVFSWTTGTGVTQYNLWLGLSGPGSSSLFNSGWTSSTSVTVPSLPNKGATIYARLFSQVNGTVQYNDYTFTEAMASASDTDSQTAIVSEQLELQSLMNQLNALLKLL